MCKFKIFGSKQRRVKQTAVFQLTATYFKRRSNLSLATFSQEICDAVDKDYWKRGKGYRRGPENIDSAFSITSNNYANISHIRFLKTILPFPGLTFRFFVTKN